MRSAAAFGVAPQGVGAASACELEGAEGVVLARLEIFLRHGGGGLPASRKIGFPADLPYFNPDSGRIQGRP